MIMPATVSIAQSKFGQNLTLACRRFIANNSRERQEPGSEAFPLAGRSLGFFPYSHQIAVRDLVADVHRDTVTHGYT